MPASVSSLIRRVDDVRGRLGGRVDDLPLDLWRVLQVLPDPRRAQGRRHELATVVAVSLGAVAAGARSLAAIGDWVAALPRWAWRRWGIRRCPPAVSTIRRVLASVDPEVLDAVLHAWLAARAPACDGDEPGERVVAVDGKTARGAVGADGSRVQLFSMVDQDSGVPLGQVEVIAGDEIGAFATVLDRICVKHVTVTADALRRARHNASRVTTIRSGRRRQEGFSRAGETRCSSPPSRAVRARFRWRGPTPRPGAAAGHRRHPSRADSSRRRRSPRRPAVTVVRSTRTPRPRRPGPWRPGAPGPGASSPYDGDPPGDPKSAGSRPAGRRPLRDHRVGAGDRQHQHRRDAMADPALARGSGTVASTDNKPGHDTAATADGASAGRGTAVGEDDIDGWCATRRCGSSGGGGTPPLACRGRSVKLAAA